LKPARLTEAELDGAIAGMHTHDGGARIDTRRGRSAGLPLWLRTLRWPRLALLRWKLRALRDERDLYESAGVVGLDYMRNSRRQERVLRGLISLLEKTR
jgi:hypothetical protein